MSATSESRPALVEAADPVLRMLLAAGQSPWLDNIRRELVSSGRLARLRDDGLRGITSNPTIFEKAVAGSSDYDQSLNRMASAGIAAEQALWDLMVEDIQAAADVFLPNWKATGGADGFVSIEVSPELASDTEGTLAMVRDLHRRCARPNVMVKIPATRAGVPAIRRSLAEGININVTLIFSVDRYVEVVDAFMSGLEDFHGAGGDLSQMASVASFFVSRVDTKVDKRIQQRLAAAGDAPDAEILRGLLGKIGIANSKLAYEKWAELHSGPRWEALAKAGARPQRCLWASTSTKDPSYPDTMYVDGLIGPDTVNTVPPDTLRAFREHGRVERSLDRDVHQAHAQIEALAAVGIELHEVTDELEQEGVAAFAKSFESLIATLTNSLDRIKRGEGPRQWHSLRGLQPALQARLAELTKARAGERLWAKDASLWGGADHPEKWLGWLSMPEWMADRLPDIERAAVKATAFEDVVVLGMGGSSLAPNVFARSFGHRPGHPQLRVLDTTDPASIRLLRSQIDPAQTLFVVASKSGSTTETLSQLAYFWEQVEGAGVEQVGAHFMAITDEGSPLQALARDRNFDSTFLNPADIGGRYSALSYFGLVPAALMGVDVTSILSSAAAMAAASGPQVEAEKSPGLWLGAALGEMAVQGRNKLTLILSPPIQALGDWIEQLIAESTGKSGTGIVPINAEPLGGAAEYGSDRIFVQLRLDSEPERPDVRALEEAGLPVITLTLGELSDLGAEFLRWEIATAIAGSILGIDPFNQPNVQESKDNTAQVLKEFEREGRIPETESVAASAAADHLVRLLAQGRPGDYLAIMAYTEADQASQDALAAIRTWARGRSGLATTSGYGPRFLHSTGQLHKGGPPTGIFLQLVQIDGEELAIPGQPYGFSVLKAAQALGDLRSLEGRHFRVLRIDLGDSPESAWAELVRSLPSAASPAP